MLFFALFTAGYFLGVFTALAIFPPRTKEIEEQERDAFAPILKTKQEFGIDNSPVSIPEIGTISNS